MKIMVWNIEKFTNRKLEEYETRHRPRFGRSRRITRSAANRLDYLRSTMTAGGSATSQPDVIAVLETMAFHTTALEAPMAKIKSAGVVNLLNHLKGWTNNNHWRVVPPLKCNPPSPKTQKRQRGAPDPPRWPAQEVVAVYYDTSKVSFEGPDTWPKAYPYPWDKAKITDATNRAGRVRHEDSQGKAVEFPNKGNRRPFMVDFREATGANRLVRCLFIHTSPGYHVHGTMNVANIQDMNPATNTTGSPNYYVACGDFNVNDWHIQRSTSGYDPYAPLRGLNYSKQLGTANQSTHFHRKGKASPSTADPYGYMQQAVIDNILICRDPSSPVPTCTAGVVNPVAGSPAPWRTAMGQSLATIAGIAPGTRPGSKAVFRQWENFWCIAATSDHAAIFVDIT